jgi:hypothetical protein
MNDIETEHLADQMNAPSPTDEFSRTEESGEVPTEVGYRQCELIKQAGDRCRARALSGRPFCFFHDPDSSEERSEASRRGGAKNRSTTLPAGTPDFPLRSSTDAAALLARTTNQLLRGEIDPKIANSAGYLIGILMKAQEANRLEERLTALEAAVGRQLASKIL